MKKIFKNKKAASEMFHLFVPILLFIVVVFFALMLFSMVQSNWLAKKAFERHVYVKHDIKGDISDPSLLLNTMLRTEFPYKDSQYDKNPDYTYNLTLYEIFYYDLHWRYQDEIRRFVEQISEEVFEIDTLPGSHLTEFYHLWYFPGVECTSSKYYSPATSWIYHSSTFSREDAYYVNTKINGNCVALKRGTYRVYKTNGGIYNQAP